MEGYERMILKDIIDEVSLPGPVSFEYNDTVYYTSTPIIDDFIDDNKDTLLYKNVISITPEVTSYGVKLIVKLHD